MKFLNSFDNLSFLILYFSLAIHLGMLIVNNDFDYLLSSEDFLRSKYVDI